MEFYWTNSTHTYTPALHMPCIPLLQRKTDKVEMKRYILGVNLVMGIPLLLLEVNLFMVVYYNKNV